MDGRHIPHGGMTYRMVGCWLTDGDSKNENENENDNEDENNNEDENGSRLVQ